MMMSRPELTFAEREARDARHAVLDRWAVAIAKARGFYEIPPGYHGYVKPFGIVMADGECGCPLAWGFATIKRTDNVAEAVWPGSFFEFVGYGAHDVSIWSYSYLRLSYTTARIVLGDVTAEDRGPLGGFRSVTLGGLHRFTSRMLDPHRKGQEADANIWDTRLLTEA